MRTAASLATRRQPLRANSDWIHESSESTGCIEQCIEVVAALAATNQKDLTRKIYGAKITVAKILYQLARAVKAEWLFNNLRYWQFLPSNVRLLLPSGTISNEALHAELNNHFRQIQSLHRSTLQLKLRIIRLAKLMAHTLLLSTHLPQDRLLRAIF